MIKKFEMLIGWLIMLAIAIVDKFSKHLIGIALVAIVSNYFWEFTEYKWMLLALAIILPCRWIVAAQEDLVRTVKESLVISKVETIVGEELVKILQSQKSKGDD